MKKFVTIIVVLYFLFLSALLVGRVQIGDYIYHPLYGRYPAVVPFEQGMTIYPGQSAGVTMKLKLEAEKPNRGI